MAKFRSPKISDVTAGTTPWMPPNVKPVTKAEIGISDMLTKALRPADAVVRTMRPMRLTVRGTFLSLIHLSGRNLRTNRDLRIFCERSCKILADYALRGVYSQELLDSGMIHWILFRFLAPLPDNALMANFTARDCVIPPDLPL